MTLRERPRTVNLSKTLVNQGKREQNGAKRVLTGTRYRPWVGDIAVLTIIQEYTDFRVIYRLQGHIPTSGSYTGLRVIYRPQGLITGLRD